MQAMVFSSCAHQRSQTHATSANDWLIGALVSYIYMWGKCRLNAPAVCCCLSFGACIWQQFGVSDGSSLDKLVSRHMLQYNWPRVNVPTYRCTMKDVRPKIRVDETVNGWNNITSTTQSQKATNFRQLMLMGWWWGKSLCTVSFSFLFCRFLVRYGRWCWFGDFLVLRAFSSGCCILVLDFACVTMLFGWYELGSFEVTCISMVFLMHCKQNDGMKWFFFCCIIWLSLL